MHPNAALITRFYEAFARLDADAMAACYQPDATFHDPVFLDLAGPQVPAMWRMLTSRASDLSVTFRDVAADASHGHAHWEASYSFGKARRLVHNRIDAAFEFRDGLIARHVDRFDLYAWSRQALGPVGVALGWSPLVQRRVRREARAGLEKWMARAPGQ